ncbi:MAG: MMPL family transporter [Nocardiaceae bacterium]|nr:MMPL family transporter [Nocardiaceae bacterium]
MNRQVAGWITHRWTKWAILAFALVFIGAIGSFGAQLTSVQKNDIASWLPGDAESTQALAKTKAFSDPNNIPAIIVFTRDSGITGADIQAITEDIQKMKGVDGVTSVTTAGLAGLPEDKINLWIPYMPSLTGADLARFTSQDGQAVQVIAMTHMSSEGWEKLPGIVTDLRKIVDSDTGGLKASIAGPAAQGADQAEAFGGIDGVLLFSAVGVVIVMLLLTYRSPVLWLIPLFCGVASVMTAQGVVYLLAKYADLTVNGQSAGILSVLVLGAGIDYALLLVARYREELHRYADRHEAMAHALHRAAPAIIASGATVVIGLLCLTFAQMNSTAGLGPVAAAGIVVALLMMLVLLPVLLVICGRWVFWPFIPRLGTPAQTSKGFWSRTGIVLARRPRAVWVGTTAALLVVSFGILQLNANGLSNKDMFTSEQPSIAAEEVLAKHFPGGEGSPVSVVANESATDEVVSTLARVPGIDAASVKPMGAKDGIVYVEATLTDSPDSKAAFATVDRARDAMHKLQGANALVGGQTAINKDVQDASRADNRLIIPIVLVVVLLILMALLRAVVAPVILLGTVVLSFGAALGISALVFRHVFGFAGADSSFPLFAFVFLVALGIDYNIFLMTRVREETLRVGTRQGALIGLAATGGVITSAGLVLAGTFAALATLPIVFLAELGFAVALGVLLDTLIVRSVLVTALNLDIGRHMWWPSKLAHKRDVEVEQRKEDPDDELVAVG